MRTPEVGRPLADAAGGLGDPLPGIGEPEGLRGLVEGDLLRQGEVGGDHNGAPLRGARTGAGSPGAAPPVVRCSGSGARGRGFEGGRSVPSPVPLCTQRVGWPTCLSRSASRRDGARGEPGSSVRKGGIEGQDYAARKALHCSMSARRRSNRSVRRYAASMAFVFT